MKLKFCLLPAVLVALILSVYEVTAQEVDSKIAAELMDAPVVSNVIVRLKAHGKFHKGRMPSGKELKGLYVYSALTEYASRTQKPLIEILEDADVEYRTYIVANAIWIVSEIDQAMLTVIARNDHVEFISSNEQVLLEKVRPSSGTVRTAEPEWGIARVHADSVWALGFRGQGVVVGGQDTGYEWDHPALSAKYRGYNGGEVDHNYNWYDAVHELSPIHNDTITDPNLTPCGVDAPVSCDDNGHGTHTMGTIVGGNSTNFIGVAPEAKWVGVRCMDRGYGSPMTYLESFEWFLAPTDVHGENPDPTRAPHVINNSWRCPEMEGCNPDNFDILNEAIENLRAAGVVVVVSAGNQGSLGCSSLASPPSIFEGSFAVGASRQNDTIAGFSSRGPVLVDSSGRVKPDVAAPGTNVRSAWLDSTYRSLNGTSMAGPHVAGAVALIISANPDLAGEVEEIENILRETARPMQPLYDCGSDSLDIPNNTYGFGIIDALAAVKKALETTSVDDVADNASTVQISPNPSRGDVNYILPDDISGRYDIRVFDIRGGLVNNMRDRPVTGSINLSSAGNGVYALVFVNRVSGATYPAKVVIGQ
jgi:subtilisin family serine protease